MQSLWQILNKAFWRPLVTLLLLVVAGLWVQVYLQQRSLFLDEANLARNIAERQGLSFFEALDYQQYAPPLFLLLEKGATRLLGNTELGLRLVPLLAGLFGLWLFWRLAVRLQLRPFLQVVAIWLLGFAPIFVRYATELKQYSLDFALTLFLVYLALKVGERSFSGLDSLLGALLGGVVIWLSMPVVFALAGAGSYLFLKNWNRGERLALARIGVMIVCWLGSFAWYYFLLLKPEVHSDYLNDYHQPYFLPFPPQSWAEWLRGWGLLRGIFTTYWGHTVLSQIIGIPALIIGSWRLYAMGKWLPVLFGLPVLTCLLASALEQYSLISRLTLFMLPLFLLVTILGVQWILEKVHAPLKLLVLLLLIATAGIHDGFQHFAQPLVIEDPKAGLQYIATDWQKEDVLYLGKWAIPAYAFYQEHHPDALEAPLQVWHGDPEQPTLLLASSLDTTSWPVARLWLLYTHLNAPGDLAPMQQDLAFLSKTYQVKEVFTAKRTKVYLAVRRVLPGQ